MNARSSSYGYCIEFEARRFSSARPGEAEGTDNDEVIELKRHRLLKSKVGDFIHFRFWTILRPS